MIKFCMDGKLTLRSDYSAKSFQASQVRGGLNNISVKCHNISKRAAIEGIKSAFKRSQGAGELGTRGITSCGMVTALKVIGHNFNQFWNSVLWCKYILV